MRNLLTLAALALALPAAAQTGPKFGKNGGVGSATSTIATGEPVGGTFSINGATGQATFRSQTIGDPTDSSAVPVAVKTKGPTPSLAIGTSLYPTNIGGSGAAKYDATSNILTNALGAKYGVFGAAAKDNVTWANSYISGIDATGHAQVYSVSTSGVYGGAFASRSSDIPGAAQDTIGSVSLGVADSTTQSNSVWGGYDAAYGVSGAFPRGLIGREISLINRGSAPSLGDPYNFNTFGFTNALRLDCGDGVSTTNGCSSAMTIVPNAGQAKSGIVFADGSLVSSGGYAPAIAMPSGYGMSWYSATAQPTWRILSNAGGSQLGQLVLGDAALDVFMNNGSTHPFGLTAAGATIVGAATAIKPGSAYSSAPNYVGSLADSAVVGLSGSSATPTATQGAAGLFQKFSSASSFNALAGLASKSSTVTNARATAVYGEAVDPAGGVTTFVEGGRFQGTVTGGDHGSGYGLVCAAGASATVPSRDYLIGCEGNPIDLKGPNALTYENFDKNAFSAAFVATNGCAACGAFKADAAFVTNPYNEKPFRTGLLFAENSIDATGIAYRQGLSIVTGIDMGLATVSYAAMILPNNVGIRAKKADGSADLGILYLDNSNKLNIGSDVTTQAVMAPNVYFATGWTTPGNAASLDSSGSVAALRVKVSPVTYGSLPTCNTAAEGTMAYITDASAPVAAWHQAVTAGGGTTRTFVQCAGTGWQAF